MDGPIIQQNTHRSLRTTATREVVSYSALILRKRVEWFGVEEIISKNEASNNFARIS